ncbi:bifunctional phosphopantothenoylcysteine decarboxylase/phosphopantothenate--cysteine ligase CoaBC [Paludibaculum fermentans]|uniref:Coenzyme A biosynthesis bifunctional protein CoaBC n=1 Tax=Paludibaculum fermentans TaxID=1473598 RepID=A0A7S7NU11_PALFE|nr:bifunctional phosphopantothenoylcysteine decarboxylase/phosphopantothenate--cysteine ligase CoaBC [Paludibaculum fermentans]QOY89704.1 bifunctional phosphopantothenoylcysteine decarboxylase/phosphopantothenate--cysteine ligase CoaBC [Paludibaculum fermentans]
MASYSAILGVGGGIAAYKAAELARALMERDFGVTTVMTESAQEFIRPLTFAALTGHKVITEMFGSGSADDVLASSVEHIRVAQEHQVLVVAPATADLLARFAHGLANDFLTTLYLAFEGPVVLAPAMNTAMWQHPATQANLETLKARGHVILDPDEGRLACGTTGPGRLPDPQRIADRVLRALTQRHDLDGETVLLTAGPTREPLDPVRFISNRSSGKMGYSLAEAAALRGARVVLVSGPVNLPAPEGVELVPVQTAQEMYDAVMVHLEASSIVIKTAAVADYHVANVPTQKVKKSAMRLSLELDPTLDILAEVGRRKQDRLLIGFAAETENLIAEARRKMQTKNCDMVVANNVSADGVGFESDQNEVVLVLSTGEIQPLPRASKRALADQILDQVLRLRLALHQRQ